MSDLVGNPEDRFSRVVAHKIGVLGVYISLTCYPDGQQKVSIDQEQVQCEPKSMAEWLRVLISDYLA